MKLLFFVSLLFLASCGKNSSPEGRMSSKIENVNTRIDSLQKQNLAILDSIESLKQQIDKSQP